MSEFSNFGLLEVKFVHIPRLFHARSWSEEKAADLNRVNRRSSIENVLDRLSKQEPPEFIMSRYTMEPLNVQIRESDLEESFFVADEDTDSPLKKDTASCVELKHIPTNEIVKIQNFRVLELNRKLARLILAEKVDLITNGKNSVVHKFHQRRAEVAEMEKEKRAERANLMNRNNSRFGRKFSGGRNQFGRNQYGGNQFGDRNDRRSFGGGQRNKYRNRRQENNMWSDYWDEE